MSNILDDSQVVHNRSSINSHQMKNIKNTKKKCSIKDFFMIFKNLFHKQENSYLEEV